MKCSLVTICFISLLFVAVVAEAQNGDYSSYYTYTMNYNPDGSATVTPTAEVTGIDDVSDWVEGQYRPVCNVRPKIELTGDADWVGGARVALGHAVDQVRTGQALQVPADGSTVYLNLSVEADVSCSGAPNPTYYMYPGIADFYNWSDVDPNFWFIAGFAPAQTGPPYWYQYCFSGDICPVGYGVASVRNFVDFADFVNVYINTGLTLLKMIPGTENGCRLTLGQWYCDYGAITWCTPETTPPDYNPPDGVHLVQKATPAPAFYWFAKALCETDQKNGPLTCYGFSFTGFAGADDFARWACKKTR